MTGLVALSFVLLAVAGCGVVTGQECEGIYADSLAHPADCRLYYNLYLMSCPEGQLYDTTTRRCSPAAETPCGQTTANTVPTEEPETTTEEPTTEEPTTEEPTTDATEDTTTEEWTTTEASSTSTTTAVPTEGSSTPKPSRYECPAVDDPAARVRYAHESDCTLYYLCVAGSPTLYRCPNDGHYSPTRKLCRPVNEAGCDRCPATEVARLPHESMCAWYYRCEDGVATLYACPDDLLFSRGDRSCTEKENAWCALEDNAPEVDA